MSVNPAAPIAQAISEAFKSFRFWAKGRKGRITISALKNGRMGLNRAIKLHPELMQDKAFKKYYNKFNKYVTIN